MNEVFETSKKERYQKSTLTDEFRRTSYYNFGYEFSKDYFGIRFFTNFNFGHGSLIKFDTWFVSSFAIKSAQ